MPHPSDDDILSQLKDGNLEACKQLFDKYYQPLCFQANFILLDSVAAEDIVQEVFIAFWEERRFESIQHSLRSYLYTMVRNACLTQLAKQQRTRQKLGAYSKLLTEADDRKLFELQELSEQMQNAIESLPEQCRMIFKRTHIDGKKYQEVADEAGISINTVKEQLRRAFRKMREALKDARFLW